MGDAPNARKVVILPAPVELSRVFTFTHVNPHPLAVGSFIEEVPLLEETVAKISLFAEGVIEAVSTEETPPAATPLSRFVQVTAIFI